MRLKVLTTVFVLCGLALLLGWPWLVGARPEGVSALRAYSLRFAIYATGTLLSFLLAAVSASFLAKQQREEYRELLLENMRRLVEGNLEDHKKAEDEVKD